jgi:hypothetical protein
VTGGGQRLLWPELEPEAIAEGWLAEVPALSSSQILEAVGRRHSMDGWNGMPGRWVFVREVQATTGAYGDVQRFDAVAVGLVPSTRYARVVYEIKVSRGDWLRERRPIVDVAGPTGHRLSSHQGRRAELVRELRDDPAWTVTERRKWDEALAVSTEFWIAAPPRCVQIDELPPEAGLVEIRPWGQDRELRARVVRPAPVRETPLPDAGFWAAVLRRAAERTVAS